MQISPFLTCLNFTKHYTISTDLVSAGIWLHWIDGAKHACTAWPILHARANFVVLWPLCIATQNSMLLSEHDQLATMFSSSISVCMSSAQPCRPASIYLISVVVSCGHTLIHAQKVNRQGKLDIQHEVSITGEQVVMISINPHVLILIHMQKVDWSDGPIHLCTVGENKLSTNM